MYLCKRPKLTTDETYTLVAWRKNGTTFLANVFVLTNLSNRYKRNAITVIVKAKSLATIPDESGN